MKNIAMQPLQFYNWQTAIAPEYGGNLCRLRHGELEILRTPDEPSLLDQNRALYGLPVLFPPNRIADGEFYIDGRRYTLPVTELPPRNNHLHGLPLRAGWDAETDGNRIVMTWNYSPEHPAFAGFPFPFRLELVYEFTQESVRQSLTAINAGTAALPCGAGFHSVFNTPERVRITASPWYWEILRPRYLVSGRQLLWDRFNPSEWFDPARHVISFHTRIETGSLDGKPFRGAILDYGVKTVLYEVDQSYRYWYLWNQDPRYGFFCPEPMSWMVDAPNLKLSRDITGFRLLPPGERAVYTSRISIRQGTKIMDVVKKS